MEYKIRKMILSDKKEVLFMMKNFYASDAVYTNGSDEIFENDFFGGVINEEERGKAMMN